MHQIGFVGFFRNSPGVTELGSPMTDLGGINWSSSAYDFSTTFEADEKEIVANKALSLRGVGFESNTVSQIAAISGVSTDTMMLAANAAHQKLYRADSSNWFDVNGVPGVRSKLIGYSTKDLNHIESEHISNGHTIFIHETNGTQQGNYFGHGYYYQEQRGRTGGIILGAVTGGAIARLNGGQLSDNTDLGTYNENSEINQTTETTNLTDEKHKVEVDYIVDTQTGFFKYHETDLVVGSEPAPWGMNFTRYYNSRDRNEYSPMGYGWRHNHMITAMEGTNSYSAYGNPSGESSADSVAQLVVIVDMLRQNPFGGYTFVATSLVLGTASTTLTNNVVNVRVGEKTYTFTLLSDNVNYAPPIGVPYRLRKNSGPYFVMTSNYDGVEYIFRPDGYIDRVVYPQGVTWTYTYGAGGNVSSVSNGVGAQINFDYGLLSLLDRVWTPNSTVAAYFKVLDQNTISQSIVLPGGVTTAYEYDSKKRMTAYYMPGSIIAGGSRPTSVYNTYDDQDRVIRQVNPASTSTFLYDATFTKVTSNGRTVTTMFDEQKRPRSIIDGTIKTDFRYDAYGRKIQETLPEGNGISYEYDANHRMTKRTLFKKPGSSLANQVETYEYTQLWGTWTRFVNRRGKEWKRELNLNNGQILWEHGPSGPSAKKVYENQQYGLLTSVTDETGMRTNYSYAAGLHKGYTGMTVSAQPGGLNLSTSRVRDDMGNATSEQDARGNTTAFAYDSQRQLIMRTETAPYSYVTKYEYDLRGNKLEESRETDIPDIWKRNKTSYSESNKVLTTTDPLGNVTKNTYDSLDRLISTEDAEGRVTKYEYNRNHQIVKVIDANGVVADVRTYTDNGKIKTIKDARGNVSTYTYDGFDRKIKLEYPDGSFEAWEYDETGPAYGKTDRVTKVITRTPAGANVITQTFDDYDRLLTRTPTGQPTETYAYDLAGRLLSVSTPPVAGNPARGKFSREYDVAGRLVKEKYQNDPANPTDTKEVSYQLDPNGNITRITYPDGYYVERTFDKLNRLENIKLNGSTTAAASFVYDKLSRRTQMVFANGVTTSYQYDLADRRTGMDVQFGGSPAPALASWRYGFNKVDQMTMQKFPDSSWEWRPPAVSTTEYGAANNLNQILTAGASTLAYADGRGNLTSDGTWTYTYNTENMLIGATNGSVTVSFDYDAENRQIRKTVGSTKTRYVYSGDQLIAEYNDTTGALLRRYVYALGKDDPIMVVDSSNVVTYLHADHLGSIIARTNNTGAIISGGNYTYSPFGQSSSLAGTTFGFTGQRFDSDLGLYHYKARYYSPALGRFLQADPAGYDVGYNLYPYAKNDPLNRTDANGMEDKKRTWNLPTDWNPGDYFKNQDDLKQRLATWTVQVSHLNSDTLNWVDGAKGNKKNLQDAFGNALRHTGAGAAVVESYGSIGLIAANHREFGDSGNWERDRPGSKTHYESHLRIDSVVDMANHMEGARFVNSQAQMNVRGLDTRPVDLQGLVTSVYKTVYERHQVAPGISEKYWRGKW